MLPIVPMWFEYSFVLKNIVFAVTISSLFSPLGQRENYVPYCAYVVQIILFRFGGMVQARYGYFCL